MHHHHSNNSQADAPPLTQNISATDTTAAKFKNDLDEAFRDLLNVSASLKQMAERSPLGYSSFRRHSIDNVLDDEPVPEPVRERVEINGDGGARNGQDVIPKPREKPVPAPRRKIQTTTVTEQSNDRRVSETVETSKRVHHKEQRSESNGVTGRSDFKLQKTNP